MTGRRRSLVAMAAATMLPFSAHAERAQPDVQAIKEATAHAPEAGERWVSARSLSHFMLAVLAKERGDLDTQLTELRLSALYETQSPYPRYALAEELARRGNDEAAEAEAREALQVDRAHAPTLMLLAKLESAKGRHERAIDTLRRAAKANPDDVEPLALLVQAHLARRDLEAARNEAEKLDAVAAASNDERHALRTAAQALGELADALSAAGDDEDAEGLYRRAAERDPSGARFVALGAFLETRGRAHDAAEAYSKAISRSNDDPNLAATAGRLYLAAGERGAAAAYIDLLARLPDGAVHHADDALLTLGYSFESASALDEARRAFEAARDVSPGRAEPYVALGRVFEALNRFDKAEAAYAKVPAGDALGLTARVRAAWCLHRKGASQAAERALDELRLEHPNDAEVSMRLAAVEAELHRLDSAEAVLEKAWHDAASPEVATAFSEVLRKQGKTEDELTLLDAARERFPDDEALLVTRANALAAAGREDEAIVAARAIVTRHPTNAAALDLLATLLVDQGQLAEAEALARRSVVAKADEPLYVATLADVLVCEGKAEEGLALADRAVRAEPSDVRVQSRVARAKAAAGRVAEARTAYERALALAKAQDDADAQARAARALESLKTTNR